MFLISMQLIVLVALLQGIMWPQCIATWNCHGSMVCVHTRYTVDNGTVSRGTTGLCDHCGSPSAKTLLKEYVTIPGHDFKCPPHDKLCQDCYNGASGAFRNKTYKDWTGENIEAMEFRDWITVFLTSGVIALAIAREVHEIVLSELTRLRFSHESSPSMAWICLEHLNAFLRRFLLLPLVLMSAVCLVVVKGGDALSVCFNALALVFLLDCDNLLYDNVLDDYTRDLVHNEGWVEIDKTAANFLTVSKFSHFVGISIAIPACIFIAYAIKEIDTFYQLLFNAVSMYSVFPVIAIVETQMRMRTNSRGRCYAILVVTVKTCLGTYNHFFQFPVDACKIYLSPAL